MLVRARGWRRGKPRLTVARVHGTPAALAADDIKCWADKAYQGAGPAVRVPIRGKNLRGWRRRRNRDHAKIRSSENAPWQPSSPGGSCGSSAAAPRGSPPSSGPSSPSNSPPDQDGKGSLVRSSGRLPQGDGPYVPYLMSVRIGGA
ncbi:hypothetical protein GCM10010264_37910 [Streptomyces globisporus]|nr:hypothetical protein GCM10010264_37910 [Streptomyces globisporus]